jgi:hypothetical protein
MAGPRPAPQADRLFQGEDQPSPLPYTGCAPRRSPLPILVVTFHHRATTIEGRLRFVIYLISLFHIQYNRPHNCFAYFVQATLNC